MNDSVTTQSVAVSLGEASPHALANRAVNGATLPPASVGNGSPPRPEGEQARGHADEGGHPLGCDSDEHPAADTNTHLSIVRASARIRIDFDRLGKDGAKAMRIALSNARHRVVTGANALARELFRRDTAALDDFMVKNGRQPRTGKEWPCPKLPSWGYTLVRQVVPELASSVAVVTSKYVHSDWGKKRWDALIRQEKRPVVAYTVTMPIEIHNQGCKLVERGGHGWLDVCLIEGRGNRVSLPLDIRDDHHKAIVKNCTDGTWRLGQPKIQEDSKRPGRWFVRLAYKRRVERAMGGKTLAVHRGIKNALVAVTSDGETMRYDGADIEAFLQQMQKRRKSYQWASSLSGRSGHGRKRILRPTEVLDRIATNWRNTKNQTIARRLIEWGAKKGCTHVVIEDLSGVRRGEPERLEGGERVYKRVQEWPFYDLGSRIVSCAEELGWTHQNVDAAFISQRSPCCGHVAKENVDLRRWKQTCGECGKVKDLDVAAALNVLARGEAKRQGGDKEYAELCCVERAPKKTARKRGSSSLKS